MAVQLSHGQRGNSKLGESVVGFNRYLVFICLTELCVENVF